MCGRYTLTDPDPAGSWLRFGLDESARSRRSRASTSRRPIRCWRSAATRRGSASRAAALGADPRYADPRRVGPAADQRAGRDGRRGAGLRDAFSDAPLPDRRPTASTSGRDRRGSSRSGSRRPDARAVRLRRALGRASGARRVGELHSCAIVTCAPSEVVAPDPRPDAGDPRAASGGAVARPRPAAPTSCWPAGADDELELTEVCDAVNSVREDGPHLLEPPLKLF